MIMTKDMEAKVLLEKPIIDIVEELGWVIAIPESPEDDTLRGIIIGEESYVDDILNKCEQSK